MTTFEDATALVARLRGTARSGVTRSFAWRQDQLNRLRTLLDVHREEFADALFADLHRSRADTYDTKVDFSIHEIDYLLEHLEQWMRPRPVGAASLVGFPATTARWAGSSCGPPPST
jgi:aldehyde dehydrogenase (NAD+)